MNRDAKADETGARGPIATRVVNGALVLVSLIVAFAIAEIAFRAADIRGHYADRTLVNWHESLRAKEDRIPGVKIQYKPHAEFEINYANNPSGYFNERNGLVYTLNNVGFRDTRDYATAKAPGTFRIVVLGDSYTIGEGVKIEHRFTEVLEALLNDGTDREFEVFNFGTSAWNTRDEMLYLEKAALDFDPDLVLVAFVLNDAGRAGDFTFWNDFREQYESSALGWSRVASYVGAVARRRSRGREYMRARVEHGLEQPRIWEQALDGLARGHKLCEQAGVKYAVVVFPFMFDFTDKNPILKIHKLVEQGCATRELPHLDLFDAYRGERYMGLWAHPSDQHPNPKGHRIAAEAIAEFLEDDGLL